MGDVAAVVGIATLVALGGWLVGSFALRVAGTLLVLSGLLGAARGYWGGLVVAAFGVVIWLAGHWLFAIRHHYIKSPLARRLLLQTPLRRIDPTRGWGWPVVVENRDGDSR
jgi:hypothetical protein